MTVVDLEKWLVEDGYKKSFDGGYIVDYKRGKTLVEICHSHGHRVDFFAGNLHATSFVDYIEPDSSGSLLCDGDFTLIRRRKHDLLDAAGRM